ncbi:class I SAM-dependent methyltransferase [Lentisphaerota bacterium ZTH]|nr:class I SAM-dependent methyltransferase [Lentisphaerota bacterium]WET06160.1 class I SAM-dependent methyltransferase [Lentisphaerota bacterium ZTH]
MKRKRIVLKEGRDKSVLRRHPWIFSGAVKKVEGSPDLGETVDIVSVKGEFLARAAFSPQSQICARAWTFEQQEIDKAFFSRRLKAAKKFRQQLGFLQENSACRLVASEADLLPGVIVDRYADCLVVQFLSAGAEYWKEQICGCLREHFDCTTVYERSDVDIRSKEGLEKRTGLLSGEEPPELIEIIENKLRYLVDVRAGHKTGFYLDQRVNRKLLRSVVKGKTVLNCFSYTGGFGVAAGAAGADMVTNVDASVEALKTAGRNMELNGIRQSAYENIEADVFKLLRKYRDMARRFDVIVLDPPKFIDSKGQLKRASRGYKDIAMLGFKLLNPGGVLLNFSCSGLMPVDLFQKITADAALDAGVNGKITARLGQSPDHPTLLSFPESFYLKGFMVKV